MNKFVGRFYTCKIHNYYDLVMVKKVDEHRDPVMFVVLSLTDRKEYKVDGHHLSREVKKEELNRYHQAYNVPRINLVLYARAHIDTVEIGGHKP